LAIKKESIVQIKPNFVDNEKKYIGELKVIIISSRE